MVKNNVKIILIRGLPGAGKSTLAKEMAQCGFMHLEADQYFEVDGVYSFDLSKVSQAHDWCVASAKAALENGQSVAVSNTFLKVWEMQRYVDLGYPFKIIELTNRWQNIHGIPEDKVLQMATRWQNVPAAWMPFLNSINDLAAA